jgi:hypoxanthine-guanine phosphoribosyltransferase
MSKGILSSTFQRHLQKEMRLTTEQWKKRHRILQQFASQECIREATERLAQQLVLPAKQAHVLILLQAGLMFGSDLVRALARKGCELKVLAVDALLPVSIQKNDWPILLVDTIADSGATLQRMKALCEVNYPGKRVLMCSLVTRSMKQLNAAGHTTAFWLPKLKGGWLVGYGLDSHEGLLRELPDLWVAAGGVQTRTRKGA